MKLPLKTRIFDYGVKRKEPFTIDELMRDLEQEYLGQRQFNKKNIENYIMAYCGVDILKAQVINSELKFSVTKFGEKSKKYIKGSF